jgi:hypothetical protein
MLPFVLVIFRAFPLSGGKYKRHGCDMAGTNKNIFTRRRKGREQWATHLKTIAAQATGANVTALKKKQR